MKEYLCEKEEVLKNYDSSEKGLTQAQADERLQKNGKNKLAEAKKETGMCHVIIFLSNR